MTHEDFESRFWGTCANTMGEEAKQLVYMHEMGFELHTTWRNSGFGWDAEQKSIVDIGGGPVSVLLKMENLKTGLVVDPGDYPPWVAERYESAKIQYLCVAGEVWGNTSGTHFDLALIYNCLQHVVDPGAVIQKARTFAKELRVFEWIEIPPHEGHPHMLTAAGLEEWCGRPGRVVTLTGEGGCYGKAWILGAAGAVGAEEARQ